MLNNIKPSAEPFKFRRLETKMMRLKITVAALALAVVISCAYAMHSAYSTGGAFSTDTGAKDLFDKECATCHGKDGRAKTFKAKFNHARNLTDGTWQADVTDERLYNSIHNGKGKMPAFAKKLSDAQINSLVAHVRSLRK